MANRDATGLERAVVRQTEIMAALEQTAARQARLVALQNIILAVLALVVVGLGVVLAFFTTAFIEQY